MAMDFLQSTRRSTTRTLFCALALAAILAQGAVWRSACDSHRTQRTGCCAPQSNNSSRTPCSLRDCCQKWLAEPAVVQLSASYNVPSLILPISFLSSVERASVNSLIPASASPPFEPLLRTGILRI